LPLDDVDDDDNDDDSDIACRCNVNAKLYITIIRNFEKNSDEYNDNSSLSSMSSSSVIIPVVDGKLSGGITTGLRNTKYFGLLRAKKLYLQSMKLYEFAFEMHSENADEDVDLLFTLALINNLGLIYDTVNEKDRSTRCFKNMFSTMMYLLMDSTNDESLQSIKEWDGLLSNAMDILKIGNEVAASAA